MLRVFIDPGHGGKKVGASYNGIHEKDLNLSIAEKVKLILKGKDYLVHLSREKDVDVSLQDRVYKCNLYNYDIFISIHCNASSNSQALGFECIYYPMSVKGQILSDSLLESAKREKQISVRKSREDVRKLYVLKHTKCPAVLVECGFMSNEVELGLLTEKSYQYLLADAIVNGVEDYARRVSDGN